MKHNTTLSTPETNAGDDKQKQQHCTKEEETVAMRFVLY
jgi:hypothetical protein